MRIIVNNADFSAVSIGKVQKDLSFSYAGDALKPLVVNAANPSGDLPWTDARGAFTDAVFLVARASDDSYTPTTFQSRTKYEYIEVNEGLVISSNLNNTEQFPVIVCCDAQQNPLGPSATYCKWNITYGTAFTFTIPAGVKYILVQSNGLYGTHYLSGAYTNS